jgi:hypothetical protein
MNYSSHRQWTAFLPPNRKLTPVEAWQYVAIQAAKESDLNQLVEFSRELQRTLNESGAPYRLRKHISLKRRST